MRQLLAITILLGALYDTASAACPAVIPVPSTETDVKCYTLDKPINVRCATAINATVCGFLNNTALSEGLVTQGGFNYLVQIGFCAMVNNFGEGDKIYDFCPIGCFAAETNLLTGFSTAGKASYAQAASIKPQGKLMSMASNATLDDVVLGPQAVKRTVSGPETTPLYVFNLASGATLRVTEHHPMVLDSGKIVEAGQVTTQMAFVDLHGGSVAITSIAREKAVADVFNFETAGDSALNHIIVAEGVLVGDLKLQNELGNEQQAIELRK